jgi:hypothetical protein
MAAKGGEGIRKNPILHKMPTTVRIRMNVNITKFRLLLLSSLYQHFSFTWSQTYALTQVLNMEGQETPPGSNFQAIPE